MFEGFWIVQYEGLRGNGGGVVIFMRGRILGGDTGFIYVGTYQADERNISARVKVQNFLPEVPNVLGIVGDFELEITAAITGGTIKGAASLIGQEGAGLAIKMMRVCDLPT